MTLVIRPNRRQELPYSSGSYGTIESVFIAPSGIFRRKSSRNCEVNKKRHNRVRFTGGTPDSVWVRADDLDVADARSLGAVAAVSAYWERLGLGAHFGDGPQGDAVFAMVANRLCDPRSKRGVVEWAAADVVVPA